MAEVDIQMTGDGADRGAGLKEQAGLALERAGRSAQRMSNYLQSHELAEMRDDLDANMRAHPLATVFVGFGTGYVLGKLLK